MNSIHDGSLAKQEFTNFPTFNLSIPKSMPNVPAALLDPYQSWAKKEELDVAIKDLAQLFVTAFKRFVSSLFFSYGERHTDAAASTTDTKMDALPKLLPPDLNSKLKFKYKLVSRCSLFW
jgi:hypothetical protein